MLMKMEKNVRFVHGIGKIIVEKKKQNIVFTSLFSVFVLVVHSNPIVNNFILQTKLLLLNGNHRHIIFVIYQIENK